MTTFMKQAQSTPSKYPPANSQTQQLPTQPQNSAQQTQLQRRSILDEIEHQSKIIDEREQDINKIVQGVEEISELFADIDRISKSQQPMLDNIDAHIESTEKYVSEANVELRKASDSQKSCIIS